MLPAIALLVQGLASQGLGILGNAILAKGKDVVEQKLGVKIPDDPTQLTPDKVLELKKLEVSHEEFLVNAALEEKKLEVDAEKAGQAQVTERWKVDMMSDSWLSKNIRPATLAYWTVAIAVLILVDSINAFHVDIPEVWVDVVMYSYLTILSAYYLGRGVEKVMGSVGKRKAK